MQNESGRYDWPLVKYRRYHMRSWQIPVCWEMCGMVTVEADTLEEAVEIARDDDGDIPLPDDAYYVDGRRDLS